MIVISRLQFTGEIFDFFSSKNVPFSEQSNIFSGDICKIPASFVKDMRTRSHC